ELLEKDRQIFELQTKVHESEGIVKQHNETRLKLETLEEEIQMWERYYSQWVKTNEDNKKLSNGIIFRDKIIKALSRKLEDVTEKRRMLSSALQENNMMLQSLKKKAESHYSEEKEYKKILEFHKNISEEKIAAIQQK